MQQWWRQSRTGPEVKSVEDCTREAALFNTHLILHPLLVVELHIFLVLSSRTMSLPHTFQEQNVISFISVMHWLFVKWVHVLHVIGNERKWFDDKPWSVVSEIGVAIVTIELWHLDALVLKNPSGESVQQTKFGMRTHSVPMKISNNAFPRSICSMIYPTFKIQECLSPNSS